MLAPPSSAFARRPPALLPSCLPACLCTPLPYAARSLQALVVATIAVCWQKPIIIAASAFLGAYFLFYGIDEFAQTGFAETLEQIMRGEPIPTLETPTILMLAFAAVTAVLGVLVQIRTSRGKDHRQKTSDTVYIQIN